MRRMEVKVVTGADGSAIAYSPRVSGKIHSVQYIKGDYVDGVDFAITSRATGENIWTESNVNASAVRYPRAPTHSQAGAAALFATGGTGVLDKIGLGNDQVKIALVQGGANKTGTFHILVD